MMQALLDALLPVDVGFVMVFMLVVEDGRWKFRNSPDNGKNGKHVFTGTLCDTFLNDQ